MPWNLFLSTTSLAVAEAIGVAIELGHWNDLAMPACC
jgi:hypothetical protein